MEVMSNMLLAQAMVQEPPYILGALVIVGFTLFLLVLIIGGFLRSHRDRLYAHTERMKALELGRDLPIDETKAAMLKAAYGSTGKEKEKEKEEPSGQKSLAVQCYTTTGWVAGLGMFFAMQATSNPGVAYAVAASAGAIGVTGMICGTILASKAPTPSPSPSMAMSKPRFDPEAV